jgi:site-specific recombinase XerD
MARMRAPRVGLKPVPVVTDDDLKALLATASGRNFADRRDTAIIYLLFTTGARISEIAGIRLGDLDLDSDPPRVTVHGKGDKDRHCSFSNEAAAMLDRYLTQRLSKFRRQLDAPLWVGERGPLNSGGIAQMLRRRARAAGINFHAHQLRHSYASTWLMNGGSETDLIEQLGWADASAPIMLRRYGRSAAAARAHAHYDQFAPSLRRR